MKSEDSISLILKIFVNHWIIITHFWRRKGEAKILYGPCERWIKRNSFQFSFRKITFIRIAYPKMKWAASRVNVIFAIKFIKHHWRTIWDCREIKVSNNLGIISNKQLIQPNAMKSWQHWIYGLTHHLFCHREKALIKFLLWFYQSNWLF